LRLNRSFLGAIYALFTTLFASGAVWLVADALRDGDGGEAWQTVALVLLGALYPLHMRLGWRANRNRVSGSLMVTINGLLILTAFGLYYFGSDVLRAWTGYVHIAVGLALPALAGVHILLGRHNRPM
jgi:hypothetical protein